MKGFHITITGTGYRFGNEFLKEGTKVKLIKEPDNKYDNEAIRVELSPLGTIGYVANSCKTVAGTCASAGRLYDKIGKKANAKNEMIIPGGAIAYVKFD